ncbi:hypothetical protein [Actinosynnema sp. NPDC020468]|uniref:hypothetical protein n=1 Tax=Actinosynnema sp. NPDC020468 TaxID=3154488 RepID=UPI0033D7F601
MPGPDFGDRPARREEQPRPEAENDLAIRLPEWNLLPPAEFVERRPRGGTAS